MAYTKQIGSKDKVTIDGTDVSNSFKEFGRTSAHTEEESSGFNATGVRETLAGQMDQSFEGLAYYTEELGMIVEPLHANRTPCVITWQPDGLNDGTRETYTGSSMLIMEFGPASQFGSVRTFRFFAKPSDGTAITVNNWT